MKRTKKYFFIAGLFCFSLNYFSEAALTANYHTTFHSSHYEIFNGGPVDSTKSKNLPSKSDHILSNAAVVSTSISPELINLVDELTHYKLPFSFSGFID